MQYLFYFSMTLQCQKQLNNSLRWKVRQPVSLYCKFRATRYVEFDSALIYAMFTILLQTTNRGQKSLGHLTLSHKTLQSLPFF